MAREPRTDPIAYFITFRTYGTWLHGDERGSVDVLHRTHGEPDLAPNPLREQFERARMVSEPLVLTPGQRTVVERSMLETAAARAWTIRALNVRTNHVHVVVSADAAARQVMGSFKAYATRALRAADVLRPEARIWSRHGSTRNLWDDEAVATACSYVMNDQ